MWKYIVFWTIVTNFVTGPDPTYDKYRISSFNDGWVPAIAVWHKSEEQKSKEFDTRQEALDFINDYPNYNNMKVNIGDSSYVIPDMGSYCENFKLDSTFTGIKDSLILTPPVFEYESYNFSEILSVIPTQDSNNVYIKFDSSNYKLVIDGNTILFLRKNR